MHKNTIFRASLRSPIIAVGLTLSAILTSGCSEEEPPPPPLEPVDRFVRLTARAQEVRELPLLRGVPIDTLTRDEYIARVDEQVQEIDDQDLEELADTYGRLGFFGDDLDLRSTLSGSRDWVGASYSSKTERITLIGDVPDDTVIHEIVHALQDQHFDLEAYDDLETSDAYLARRAVVEGDADLAGGRFILNEEHGSDLYTTDWEKLFLVRAKLSRQIIAGSAYPFFAAYPSFTYNSGVIYCVYNLTGATPSNLEDTLPYPFMWSREDALFGERPPASTRQIMTLDAQGAGAVVGLGDVPSQLTERFERVDWDVLGAYYTYLLFYPVRSSIDVADPLDLEWEGDRALFVRDRQTSDVGVVWTSRWSSAEAAERAETALRAVHGVTADMVEPSLGTADNGEVTWIERDDAQVVFLKNVDAALAPELAGAALSTTAPRIAPPRARPPLDRRIRIELGRARRSTMD